MRPVEMNVLSKKISISPEKRSWDIVGVTQGQSEPFGISLQER